MKVTIIGGSGKMGRWFARLLLKEGKEVVITGRNKKKLQEAKRQLGVKTASNIEAVKTADVVILSIPIDNFEAVVRELQPYFRPEQTVVDITSVKTFPVEIMHKYIKSGRILGTHPVFGPGARSLTNQNFVLTPTNKIETAFAQKVKQYLETKGTKATLMTPQEHDEMMAVILGLAHFIAIVSADTLLNFNKLKERGQISGTTYRLLLTLVESVLSEDPELYASIQMNLHGIPRVHEQFQKNVEAWTDIVRLKDRREFVKRMKALKNRLEKTSPEFGKSYEDIYRLLDKKDRAD
jgi:prephenate dehydrogenase